MDIIEHPCCRQRNELSADNERLRAALEAIVDIYGRDPETVHIPAGLIRDAEAALGYDVEQKVNRTEG